MFKPLKIYVFPGSGVPLFSFPGICQFNAKPVYHPVGFFRYVPCNTICQHLPVNILQLLAIPFFSSYPQDFFVIISFFAGKTIKHIHAHFLQPI